MAAIKGYSPSKSAEDLVNIIVYAIPSSKQSKKPDSQNSNVADISDKVNIHVTLALTNPALTNLPNYGPPAFPYGTIPYIVSDDSYGLAGAYLDRRVEAMHDFTDRVPGKQLNSFSVSGNEGLFGFTYLGDVHVWRRDDLTGELAKMVDVHESIHTPDEYETRRITEWMMQKERSKYIK